MYSVFLNVHKFTMFTANYQHLLAAGIDPFTGNYTRKMIKMRLAADS